LAVSSQQSNDYSPSVQIVTSSLNHFITIRIRDNGKGIPENVKQKIFEPFFTTKPAGEGTGLGLSISYDIIKAHGGEMKVESKENEYAEFIISIPSST
jgi:signal transduction histidine kinase